MNELCRSRNNRLTDQGFPKSSATWNASTMISSQKSHESNVTHASGIIVSTLFSTSSRLLVMGKLRLVVQLTQG